MKYFITYSDESFQKQKDFALKMARFRGGFDRVIGYSKNNIDTEFYEKNKHILDKKRGGGYWLWKPYFIVQTLKQINNGDYLFYSDAGAFFLKNVDILINELGKYNQDIMGFELPLIEKQWTKKELFISMGYNDKIYMNSNQILASYILIKKTDFSVNFFNQYLQAGCYEINITDKYDSTINQDKEFIDHRHDQSIFSLLYKKCKLRPFKDPSQFGEYPKVYSASQDKIKINFNQCYKMPNGRLFVKKNYSEKYSDIIFHNRGGSPLTAFIKFQIKTFLSALKIYNGLA